MLLKGKLKTVKGKKKRKEEGVDGRQQTREEIKNRIKEQRERGKRKREGVKGKK